MRDSIVVERTDGGGLQAMVSTDLVSMSLVDIEEPPDWSDALPTEAACKPR